VGACSPTDFIKEVTQLFMGVSCDHSLRGVTSLYNVLQVFIEERGAPGGPGCSKSTQNRQNFLLSVRKPVQNSEQTKTEDGQTHFGSVFGY
jgi:hypothetical protein